MQRRLVAAIAITSTAAACGLSVVGTAGDAADSAAPDAAIDSSTTDALRPDGTTPDGTTPIVDASPVDEDASPIVDAGTDARPDADASPPPTTFCTGSTASLCADFDAPGATVTTGWDPYALVAGSTVALSNAPPTPHSAPRSLHAVATGGNPAAVRKNITVNSSLTVDFWVRFHNLPGATGVISPVRLTPPNPPGEDFHFFASTTKSYFQEFGDDYSTMLAGMTEDVWHHVVMKLTTTTSRIDATVDGTAYWTNHQYPHAWPIPTTAMVELGAASLYMTAGTEVWIDDVVITAQ